MADKVNIVGAKPKRVQIADKPKRRIEPAELAAALGTTPDGAYVGANLDLISLAEIGKQLLNRLRSTGGRPALADATEYCRVPLSTKDVGALEAITKHIEESTGTRPSPGQLVSVIVRNYLRTADLISQGTDAVAALRDKANEVSDWLPRLTEIASQARAVQKTATTIETAVKEIQKDIGNQIA